jgi:acyl-CoA-binding protein
MHYFVPCHLLLRLLLTPLPHLFHSLHTDGTKDSIEYAVNSVLMALHKQITRGPFIEENEPELGWFDFVGHDRRDAWELLGDMSKPEAMDEFVRPFLLLPALPALHACPAD